MIAFEKEILGTPCNATDFGGANCFVARIFDLRALSQNSYHATVFMCFPTEALANRRYLRSVFYFAMYRGVMSGSESVPLRKALKLCMLFRHCAEHALIRALQSKAPLEILCCLAACPVFPFSDANQGIGSKNFNKLNYAVCKIS